MNIIFALTVFHFSSDLQFKYELAEEIQLNEQNLIAIANSFIIVPKNRTCKSTQCRTKPQKVWLKKEKNGNKLCRVFK
jgi:hypothetical protein